MCQCNIKSNRNKHNKLNNLNIIVEIERLIFCENLIAYNTFSQRGNVMIYIKCSHLTSIQNK